MRSSITTHTHRAFVPFFRNYALSRSLLSRISCKPKFIPEPFSSISLICHISKLLFLQSNLALEILVSLLNSCLRVLILWRCQSLPIRLIQWHGVSGYTRIAIVWGPIVGRVVGMSQVRLGIEWALIS
jgi:hypothetical protein